MLFLVFIASSCRVNEENLLFEIVQSGPPSFFRMLTFFLKDLTFVLSQMLLIIRKTCPCDLYPLTPQFYIVKLGFTVVYIFSYFRSKR